MFRKIYQETEVLKDMLVENGHEKTLPENNILAVKYLFTTWN